MPSDWKETQDPDSQETDTPSSKMSDSGQRSIQGFDKPEGSTPADKEFVDAEGRDITLRTFPSGDRYYIRAYDRNVQEPPGRVDLGQAGQANLHLERSLEPNGGKVERGRLEWIETFEPYKGKGTASKMLEQAEEITRQNSGREIYGSAPGDAPTRDWYTHRDYQFRTGSNGEEVFKPLNKNKEEG